MTPITRVYLLPKDTHPRAEPALLHQWPGHLPYVPEGKFLTVGERTWRVRYYGVAVDEARGEAVQVFTVQDAREEPRI